MKHDIWPAAHTVVSLHVTTNGITHQGRCLCLQSASGSFPCPINSSTTACTLFAATDESWEALAAFVGVDISTFEHLPVVDPVRSCPPCALCLTAFNMPEARRGSSGGASMLTAQVAL